MKQTKHFKRTVLSKSAKSMVSLLLLLVAMLMPQGAWAAACAYTPGCASLEDMQVHLNGTNGNYNGSANNEILASLKFNYWLDIFNYDGDNGYWNKDLTMKIDGQTLTFYTDYACTTKVSADYSTVLHGVWGVFGDSNEDHTIGKNKSGSGNKAYFKTSSGLKGYINIYNYYAASNKWTTMKVEVFIYDLYGHKVSVCGTYKRSGKSDIAYDYVFYLGGCPRPKNVTTSRNTTQKEVTVSWQKETYSIPASDATGETRVKAYNVIDNGSWGVYRNNNYTTSIQTVGNTTTSAADNSASCSSSPYTYNVCYEPKATYKDNGSSLTGSETHLRGLSGSSSITLNHVWGESSWKWDDDGHSATCTRACTQCSQGDASKTSVTVTLNNGITAKQQVAPNCTTKGTTRYTATATVAGTKYTSTKDVVDIAALGHSLTATPAKAATCTEAGNNAYWTCSTCKKVFSNSTATTETTVDAQTIVIPHSYSDGICTACNGYETPAGNGTSSSPYLIGNQGNLLWFADKCRNTNSVRNFHAKQTANIVYTQDSNWRGLGSDAWKYIGTYDGDGHTISGLKCNADYSSARIGMFGIIGPGGKVMNLGLLNVSLSGREHSYIGAFAYESYGTITNCYATGSISGQYIAGICCDNMATISNCYSAVQLNKYNSASKTYPIADENAPTNCYSTSSSSPSAQFTSGEVCYKLNGGNTSGIWKQTIGTDKFPVFDKNHATVYSVQNTKCDGVTTYSVYTNNSNQQPTVDAHSLTATPAKAETCTEAGNNAYWTCSTCNKVFSNSNATTETTVAAQTIAALSHDYSQIEDANYLVSPATCTNDAVYHEKCSRCDTKEGPLWGVKGTATGNHDYTSHTLTLVEDGLYAYACDNGCGTHTDDHIIKDFNGEGNHLELTKNGSAYSTSEDIILADANGFVSPVDFSAPSVTYTRTGIKNQWGTIVVPFDVNGSGDDYDLYTLFEMDDYNLTLMKFSGTLPAGTPVIFRLHDDLAGNYSLTLTASNTTVSGQFNEGSEANGLQLVGTYETIELDINDYFISNNQFWRVYDAWAAAWGVKVAPFRAYLKSTWAGSNARRNAPASPTELKRLDADGNGVIETADIDLMVASMLNGENDYSIGDVVRAIDNAGTSVATGEGNGMENLSRDPFGGETLEQDDDGYVWAD